MINTLGTFFQGRSQTLNLKSRRVGKRGKFPIFSYYYFLLLLFSLIIFSQIPQFFLNFFLNLVLRVGG